MGGDVTVTQIAALTCCGKNPSGQMWAPTREGRTRRAYRVPFEAVAAEPGPRRMVRACASRLSTPSTAPDCQQQPHPEHRSHKQPYDREPVGQPSLIPRMVGPHQ
jgi:hypothetical protein